MDDGGIPIAIEILPGSTLDPQTLRTALQNAVDGPDCSRFILTAGRGSCNDRNRLRLTDAGNGYIVSESFPASAKNERAWILSDADYTAVSDDFQYKSRIVKRSVKDENGNTRTIEEKVVVYRSGKLQERREQENKSFLHFLKKLEEDPEDFKITALQYQSLRKFMKQDCLYTETGEPLHFSDIKPLIDFDKAEEYRRSLGCCRIVTSELNMDALEVIRKYHDMAQIEDRFRMMQGTLETRSVHARTPEHVSAQLLISTIALIVLRIIQKRVVQSGAGETDCRNNGLSADRITNALNKWKVELLPGALYRFLDTDDPDLRQILHAFDIQIPEKLYRRADIKSIRTGIEVFR